MALGGGGFAADTAPDDALIAVPDGAGGWAVGETVDEARRAAGKVQGRRTTVAAEPPLALPDGALGPHPAHLLGRTGLPGARRRLVRPRR